MRLRTKHPERIAGMFDAIDGPVALALRLSGRAGRKTALPLGPALLAGALVAVIGHAVLRG